MLMASLVIVFAVLQVGLVLEGVFASHVRKQQRKYLFARVKGRSVR